MKKRNFDSVKDKFFDIYSFICNLTDDEILHGQDDNFRLHFERLHRLSAIDVDDRDVEEMLCDKKIQLAIKHISCLKRKYGLKTEIEFAQSIIDSPAPLTLLKHFKYYSNYIELAQMEYKGGGLKPKDRVVFIGSGPLPMTLVSLCQQYGVYGIGIEKISEYVNLSRKFIEALELTGCIDIVQGNHLSLPVHENVQLVMVGADAYPKDEIFIHLAKTLDNGTRLSYRVYEKGFRRLLNDHPVLNIPDEFKEYARMRPKPPVNNTSIFLTKDISR